MRLAAQLLGDRERRMLRERMPHHLQSFAAALVCAIVLGACSPAGERTPNAAAPAPVQPAPPTTAAPLKVPERVASGAVTESGGGWNQAVQNIRYASAADNTQQPAMFYRAPGDEPRPLLVGLHSWSSGYQQDESAIYAEWAIANGWNFIHPHTRGPMETPQSTGSELVIGDVLSAIEYAKKNARVDESRIYAIGWSGGGYLGLLLAGRAPQVWAGISAWVPISDLNAWYGESVQQRTQYAPEIAASCGGKPVGDTSAARECRQRSPLAHIDGARNVPIDIHHGIHDGHGDDPVPISQSLVAFNALAAPEDRFTSEQIVFMNKQQQVPPGLSNKNTGDANILLRRQSGNVRLTVFDGGHEKNTEAGLRWLNQQRKS